jgi:hypothetical protein
MTAKVLEDVDRGCNMAIPLDAITARSGSNVDVGPIPQALFVS